MLFNCLLDLTLFCNYNAFTLLRMICLITTSLHPSRNVGDVYYVKYLTLHWLYLVFYTSYHILSLFAVIMLHS